MRTLLLWLLFLQEFLQETGKGMIEYTYVRPQELHRVRCFYPHSTKRRSAALSQSAMERHVEC